ncbi:hypothetical protein [Streptosporangium sp. NBC_01756]|uniref:hypothetical protein n=1 Tax=Streptosporangium sp. NBC_01756 TaxID=2975950 RepID=UPI002DD7EBED|nr:hypothetical protein [Streptosporangium sp. NBC_01756]WSC87337.1 hypothetical protein OIE48_03745 [Streptosporangium sp. NBC_01756]
MIRQFFAGTVRLDGGPSRAAGDRVRGLGTWGPETARRRPTRSTPGSPVAS